MFKSSSKKLFRFFDTTIYSIYLKLNSYEFVEAVMDFRIIVCFFGYIYVFGVVPMGKLKYGNFVKL